jgi:hypothetical protein
VNLREPDGPWDLRCPSCGWHIEGIHTTADSAFCGCPGRPMLEKVKSQEEPA